MGKGRPRNSKARTKETACNGGGAEYTTRSKEYFKENLSHNNTRKLANLINSLDDQTNWTPEWLRRVQTQTNHQATTLSRQGKIYARLFAILSLDDNGILRYEMTFGKDIGTPETRGTTIVPKPVRQEAIN